MKNKTNKISSFYDLQIWKLSHELVIEIYKITKSYPKSEIFGIVSQIQRASSSIPANIVEGYYRNTTKEFLQFLYNARGSCGGTIYFLILSKDIGYISLEIYQNLFDRYTILIRKISAMINSLKLK